MKTLLSLTLLIFFIASANSAQCDFDAEIFVRDYFKAWTASQSPNAAKNDIEQYLRFIKDDVGHQHLPFDPMANRSSNGKEKMRDGMQFYLGAHTEYRAKLEKIMHGFGVIVTKYEAYSKGMHPQTDELIEQSYNTVEVLEFEDCSVFVIRKYSE